MYCNIGYVRFHLLDKYVCLWVYARIAVRFQNFLSPFLNPHCFTSAVSMRSLPIQIYVVTDEQIRSICIKKSIRTYIKYIFLKINENINYTISSNWFTTNFYDIFFTIVHPRKLSSMLQWTFKNETSTLINASERNLTPFLISFFEFSFWPHLYSLLNDGWP